MSPSLGTLSQQCAGLEAGEISSRELVGQALKRAREQKALFNAIAGTRDDAALSEAEESDRRRAKGSLRSDLDGIPIVINSDAHSLDDLSGLQFGVFQARRAGLLPTDVANTRPLSELQQMIR